ncbi:hypothetical protein AAKU67_001494 [Oxalobacteraceae bacterium GrIS 2.11]
MQPTSKVTVNFPHGLNSDNHGYLPRPSETEVRERSESTSSDSTVSETEGSSSSFRDVRSLPVDDVVPTGGSIPQHIYRPEPTDLGCMNKFCGNFVKVIGIVCGAAMVAGGILFAISGGAVFGAGLAVTLPVGGGMIAAGLVLMGYSWYKISADQLKGQLHGQLQGQLDQLVEQINGVLRASNQNVGVANQLRTALLELKNRAASSQDLQRLYDEVQALRNKINSMEIAFVAKTLQLNQISVSSPSSSSSFSSQHSSPDTLPTGTGAWTTNSPLKPLSDLELYLSPATSPVVAGLDAQNIKPLNFTSSSTFTASSSSKFSND